MWYVSPISAHHHKLTYERTHRFSCLQTTLRSSVVFSQFRRGITDSDKSTNRSYDGLSTNPVPLNTILESESYLLNDG